MYAGGRIVTSAEDAPEDVPKDGLVLAVHPKHQNGNLVYPGDWFVYRLGQWWGHDLAALLRLAIHDLKSIECVRQGVFVSDPEYQDLVRIASRPELFAWAQ